MTGGPTLQSLLAGADTTLRSIKDEKLASLLTRMLKPSIDYQECVLNRPRIRSLAFFCGWQNIRWSNENRRFYPMPFKPEDRMTINLFRSRTMLIASSYCSHRPKFSVIPEENSTESRADARPADLILSHIWNESKFTTRNTVGALHRALFGGVFWKAVYDEYAGVVDKKPLFALDIDGEYLLDEQGQRVPIMKGKQQDFEWTQPLGQVRADLVSVFEAITPASAQLPIVSELPWIATRKAVPIAEVKRRWGLKVASRPEAVDPVQIMNMTVGSSVSDFGRALEPARFAESMFRWEADEATWVTEVHFPHSEEKGFEGGLVLTLVDDKVVERADGSLSSGELPFEYQPSIPVPLRFDGDTPTFDMQEPQLHYNSARANVEEMRRASVFPYVLYPEDNINASDVLSGKRWIPLRMGGVDPRNVQLIETAKISQAVVSELQMNRADIDATAAQAPFSRGEMYGASPQPVGTVQALQKADLSDLQPGMDISDEAQGELGRKLLILVRDNYSAKRLAVITSDDTGDIDSFLFSQTDLPRRLRVVIRPKSSLTDTDKGALRSQFAEIAKSGILGNLAQDPAMQGYMLDLFSMPAPEQFVNSGNLDYRRQEREIEQMLRGEYVQLGPFDDHQAHLAAIGRFTKTSRWDRLDDQVKQFIMAHAQEHQAIIQQQQQQALMQQIAMQQMAAGGGIPDGTGEAEPTTTPTGLPV